ncbi:hypothetical protein A4X06_0g3938 [Tilletia controversa]|uniref:RNA polymerase II transcription factor B subunit 2 n=1 Tax=Tilletia controversa TaxID=13291 RepID=A0A8X7SX49_9BASI|nr:hypothetical protein A4X06_0g3938 [Tilletia controversa]
MSLCVLELGADARFTIPPNATYAPPAVSARRHLRPSTRPQRGWPAASARNAFETALGRLEALWIVSKSGPTPSTKLTMSYQFRTSMRRALTGGGTHRSFGVPCDTPDSMMVLSGMPRLNRAASSSWRPTTGYMRTQVIHCVSLC